MHAVSAPVTTEAANKRGTTRNARSRTETDKTPVTTEHRSGRKLAKASQTSQRSNSNTLRTKGMAR